MIHLQRKTKRACHLKLRHAFLFFYYSLILSCYTKRLGSEQCLSYPTAVAYRLRHCVGLLLTPVGFGLPQAGHADNTRLADGSFGVAASTGCPSSHLSRLRTSWLPPMRSFNVVGGRWWASIALRSPSRTGRLRIKKTTFTLIAAAKVVSGIWKVASFYLFKNSPQLRSVFGVSYISQSTVQRYNIF